jgi:hypothetical protein
MGRLTSAGPADCLIGHFLSIERRPADCSWSTDLVHGSLLLGYNSVVMVAHTAPCEAVPLWRPLGLGGRNPEAQASTPGPRCCNQQAIGASGP